MPEGPSIVILREQAAHFIGHDVGAPVVDGIELALDVFQRRGVEIQFAIVEREAQARFTLAALIDPVAAPQQEVHPQCEAGEAQDEMLAPAAQVVEA